jgi:hypothetical protein
MVGIPVETPEANKEAFVALRRALGVIPSPNPVLTPRLLYGLTSQRLGVRDATIVFVGDSNTMGGLGNGLFGNRAQSMPMLAQSFMSREFDVEGDTFCGAAVSDANPVSHDAWDPRISHGSGWVLSGGGASLGGTTHSNTTTLSPLTFNPKNAWDKFDIVISSSASAHSFKVDDGVTTTIFTPATTGALQKFTFVRGGGSPTAPAVGSINISRITGNIYCVWGHAYNSTVKKVAVFNAGRYGWTANDWKSQTNTYSPLNALLNLNPDYVDLQLGLNEYNTGVSVAVFKANMQIIITALKNAGISVGLTISATPNLSGGAVAPWADFAMAILTLGANNALPVQDFGEIIGPYDAALANGFMANSAGIGGTGLHLSPQGYACQGLFKARSLTWK